MLQESQRNNKEVGFWDHVADLRSKIILSLLAVVIGALVANPYHQYLADILLRLLGQHKLVFLSVFDPLIFIFKIDLVAGIIIASPIISWLAFSFIKPAMERSAWSKIAIFYISSMVLVVIGILYAYFIAIPISLTFLFSFTVPGIVSTINAQSYLSFLLTQSLISSVIFQIPIFIVAGSSMGVFTTNAIASRRRYIYLVIVIIFSLVTPTTDLFSLLMVIVPTIMLFEGGLLVSRFIEKRKTP